MEIEVGIVAVGGPQLRLGGTDFAPTPLGDQWGLEIGVGIVGPGGSQLVL